MANSSFATLNVPYIATMLSGIQLDNFAIDDQVKNEVLDQLRLGNSIVLPKYIISVSISTVSN